MILSELTSDVSSAQSPPTVTKFKPVLLAARLADKLRDELLGQGTFFRKSSDREDGRLIPKNHLAWVRIQAPFILKGEGVKSNISWFLSFSGGNVFISSSL